MADLIINTSKFTCTSCASSSASASAARRDQSKIMIYVTSFGYRNGMPPDSDLVFDVRFLPNPNYIPRFKNLTGPPSGRGALHPLFPADRGVHRAHHRPADLPFAALYPRGQELSDDRLRLHRRAAPLGDDGRRFA
jgi:hypothetical protein